MENENLAQTQIQQIVDSAVSNIRNAAEVNTIIGSPMIAADGSTILPVSQVSFAFVAGGGQYGKHKKQLIDASNSQFAGGSGGGATLSPVGFLILNQKGTKLIKFQEDSTLSKIADVAGALLNSLKN